MGGYEAIIGEIRRRGEDAIDVGEATAKVELGEAAGGIAAAMPGSAETPGEAEQLSEHWEGVLRDLGRRVSSYGDDMVRAAERYEEEDEPAAENLRLHTPGPGGPV
ncbi:hypothetical protein SAMN06265360_10587 [Haloechinothrix alba]|uniref:Excreted virulence factor EspC, type VII ESX diderm n=1 Tax=Haloechinothrix alba TaxID=664784 RepID=A0A238W3I8_9PSEU|nr:hypothetical protein [Haloechinothrix alba]SNR41175.1 hypothetical protein SAMN06265360_10587 [Haloechinothrix alba]